MSEHEKDISTSLPTSEEAVENGQDDALRRQVEEALDSIRPYLNADGGSVRLLNITAEMVVELELLGACGSCPMSTMTLRAGIEQAIKRAVPRIERVEAVNSQPVF
jgi:Fe-S cluster biogenesis protein NfuA